MPSCLILLLLFLLFPHFPLVFILFLIELYAKLPLNKLLLYGFIIMSLVTEMNGALLNSLTIWLRLTQPSSSLSEN